MRTAPPTAGGVLSAPAMPSSSAPSAAIPEEDGHDADRDLTQRGQCGPKLLPHVIVEGGVKGLFFARLRGKQGLKVTLLERSVQVGGKIATVLSE